LVSRNPLVSRPVEAKRAALFVVGDLIELLRRLSAENTGTQQPRGAD
jgi:hypothetical protein